MSRSYRKPYATCCGVRSSKYDKRLANRGVRRAQNQYVHNVMIGSADFDDRPIPHRYECSHNEVYSWNRDGKQNLVQMHHNDYNVYWLCWSPCVWSEEELIQHRDERVEHGIRYIEEIQRK